MNFGKRLKELRKQMGLTQEDLAKALDMSKSNISKYERDELEPSLATLIKISQVLKIDLNTLVGVRSEYIDPRNDYRDDFGLNASVVEATYERFLEQICEEFKERLKDQTTSIKALTSVILQDVFDLTNTTSSSELSEIQQKIEIILAKKVRKSLRNSRQSD